MYKILTILLCSLIIPWSASAETIQSPKTLTDALNRQVEIPKDVKYIICSGSGALRLITYLQAQDMVVAVDDGETRDRTIDPRPYVMANPEYKTMEIFGAMSGDDNPELILSLKQTPDLIIKTNTQGRGLDPIELEKKTGIPVLVIDYADLGLKREALYQTIELLGQALNKEERAKEVVSFMKSQIAELQERTKDVPEVKNAFIGGVAWSGSHGLEATEPSYPPFLFANVNNVAYSKSLLPNELSHSKISKEKILSYDPEYLFLDLATTHNGAESGGLFELKTDKAYQTLSAVQNKQVYGVLPYTWVNNNFDTTLVDAWYIGSVVYPEKFSDINIASKADEIYEFLVGKKIYQDISALYPNQAFQALDLSK